MDFAGFSLATRTVPAQRAAPVEGRRDDLALERGTELRPLDEIRTTRQ